MEPGETEQLEHALLIGAAAGEADADGGGAPMVVVAG